MPGNADQSLLLAKPRLKTNRPPRVPHWLQYILHSAYCKALLLQVGIATANPAVVVENDISIRGPVGVALQHLSLTRFSTSYSAINYSSVAEKVLSSSSLAGYVPPHTVKRQITIAQSQEGKDLIDFFDSHVTPIGCKVIIAPLRHRTQTSQSGLLAVSSTLRPSRPQSPDFHVA